LCLEVKLPTIRKDEKHRWEESEKRRGEEERRSEKRKSQSRKVVNHCVFSNGLWLRRVEK